MAHQIFEDAERSGLKVREIDAVSNSVVDLALVPVTIHGIRVISAAAAISFMKFWNQSGDNITLGTTAPDGLIIPIINAGNYTLIFKTWNSTTGAWEDGYRGVHTTALSVACVTTAGTAGITAPSANVSLHIAYEEV